MGGTESGGSGGIEQDVRSCLAELGSQGETLALEPRQTRVPEGAVVRSTTRSAALSRDGALTFDGVLGEGGMGVVHLATQTALGRKVAVKMLRPERRSPQNAAKLLREATITGALEHPNVTPVYDVRLGEDGMPRVVLKRIEGLRWSQLLANADLARRHLGEGDVLVEHLGILMQVCHAAHFAHARGIAHRDIKPENVMIGEFGEVYLLDWGIAVELDDTLPFKPSGLAGTPAYMAPEMLCMVPVTAHTDVYLLGSCLYELLNGRAPHAGATAEDLVRSVLYSEPRFDDDVPTELRAINERALARDPADRFATAEAFRLALADFIQHRDSRRLADKAASHLLALEQLVTTDGEQHARLLRTFGACRFGFREALGTWPDNVTARAGLARALSLMTEHEIARGNVDAAEALLDELSEIETPPARLLDEVERTRHLIEEEEARVAELERVGRMFDPETELRARWLVTTALALLGTVAPVATQRWVDPHSNDYATTFVHPAGFLLITLAIAWHKREAIAETAYNRWALALIIAACVGQLCVLGGGALMGLKVISATAMVALLWSMLAGMLAGAVDRRVWPVSLGFFGVFLAIATWVDDRRHANYLMSAGLFVTTVTVFITWRPKAEAERRASSDEASLSSKRLTSRRAARSVPRRGA